MYAQLGYEDNESKKRTESQSEETETTDKHGNDTSSDDEALENAGSKDSAVAETNNKRQPGEGEVAILKSVPVAVNYVPRLIPGLEGHSIDSITAGNHFVIATSSSGQLFGWGRNSYGQLGLGHDNPVISTPIRIDALTQYVPVHVSAGQSHTVGIFLPRSDCNLPLSAYSIVCAWGNCTFGRLGMGWTAAKSEMIPREVTFFRGLGATSSATGADHSLVLCGSGGGAGAPTFVYAFGGNEFGQLGIGMLGATFVDMPMLVDELTGVSVTSIGAGACYSAALTRTLKLKTPS